MLPPLGLEATAAFPTLDAALSYLFSSFESRHRLHRGQFDREFRRPEVLIELAGRLGVLPSPEHTCLVTGSKGKGTVSRMLAWNQSAAGLRVGLLLTPEELDHRDRIRIDGLPIPAKDFCRILGGLRPLLDATLASQPDDFYFAPSGLFLLVGLVWFHEQAVDAWVIEGGRGVQFDEIGQLDAAVGVVTNVLLEHAERLGPTLEQIAADKLTLAKRCRTLVAGPSIAAWRHVLPEQAGSVLIAERSTARPERAERPNWLAELDAIAKQAAQPLRPALPWQSFDTPAFFFARGGIAQGKVTPGTVCCDAAIHADCLDIGFLQRTGLAAGAALIGLSADKDGEGIVERLGLAGFVHVYTVGLSSRIGHIRAWTAADGHFEQVAALEVTGDAEEELLNRVLALATQHGSVYVVGVQMFIRAMRQVLQVGLMNPVKNMAFNGIEIHA
jgi:dihydrofolate synthase/folylpolyglutamate synthase